MKRVQVAVAVVIDDATVSAKVLIAKRADHLHQGGLWEFPGGKVEPGETVFSALKRELLEEVDLHVLAAEPLLKIEHDYSDKYVFLDVWRVTDFKGLAKGLEGQLIRWVSLSSLMDYEFPQANTAIVEYLLRL